MKTILKNLSLMMAVLISLSSCLDGWENPISDVQDAKVDKRLIGTWVFTDDSESKGKIHIYEIDEHSLYSYSYDPSSEQRCVLNYHEFRISEVDGRTFVNSRRFNCGTKEFSKYDIDEYEFNGENEVIIYPINEDFVEEAIRDKELPGEDVGNEYHNYVVTATSQEIREFIRNSPKEKLFDRDNPLILKRFERPKVAKKSICILF